ncbi:MAG TPA: OmpA family protein [Thermoanaerobaculia bacterium]|jgi:outer membrane protein OmpA-like peptidoglycan-associated protein|nr:OmpA family protein [Thermoanaerobaculia bacterium]
MLDLKRTRAFGSLTASVLIVSLFAGCATTAPRPERQERVTKRDRTVKGAGIGAAAGAAAAVLKGKREADEILAGAAIGAVIGGGIGAYMDAQQEKLARIPGTSVERVDEDTLLVHFDSDVLFGVDSANLDSDGRATLEDVASVINQYPKTAVVVQGHTDSTGSEEHNQELSDRRASSVRGYLVSRGVDADRVAAVGMGEGYPVASNDSESGRQQNRRVDILLKAKAGPLRQGR